MISLNQYQLLFFNREINFGNSASNVLKGYAEIKSANFERLYDSVNTVLKKSEWTYLSIDKNSSSWIIKDSWNGRLEKSIFLPEIAIDKHLWTVQLVKDEDSDKIRLHLFLHHCLADAHSFNLFWDAVFNQYQNGIFEIAPLFPELSYSKGQLNQNKKNLRTDLGIGSIRRISLKFNQRIKRHLITLANQNGTSLMSMLLEYIENELENCEGDLEIPLKLGIALRNRRNVNQKNAFPTVVNFLPLQEDSNLSMQQKVMQLFRYQDYPLMNYLNDNKLPLAFNVLFSYQKEYYLVEDGFESKFTFEASTSDDNILGIHLLEYDDDSFMLHLDYRIDIASESYWKSVLRKVSRKITADYLKIPDNREVKNIAILYPKTTQLNDFWYYFDQAPSEKIALICNDYCLTFAEIRKRISGIKFNPELKLHRLMPERTIENIIELLAAWKNGITVTYQQLDDFKEPVGSNASFVLQETTAYIAQSSGTTGEQKTIQISFDGLCSLIPDWKLNFKTGDSYHLCLADQRFDVFFGDLLRSIISGETMVFATDDERLNALKIDRLLREYGVSHFESTPSFLSYLLPEITDLSGIKVIICGSEPIQKGFYESLQQSRFKDIDFFNSYGLTECSIDTAIARLKRDKEGRFPSGFPVGDQIISIRDTKLGLKPKGIWGEIYIEGSCVGIQSCKNDSYRIFKTGDCGMITEDGLIVNGRINEDFIKINGRRVPSAMIEQLTSSINGVKNCLCMEVRNMAVLFVFGNSDVQIIRTSLSKVLSRYQQPDDYFFCSEWPINQNGKSDRKKLLEWYQQKNINKQSWQPGTHPSDKILFECLKSREKLFGAANDSLISFGWNSIELLSLANELNMKGVFVPLASFIQNPSISFILESATQKQKIENRENPEADDFDIDDILSILNNN